MASNFELYQTTESRKYAITVLSVNKCCKTSAKVLCLVTHRAQVITIHKLSVSERCSVIGRRRFTGGLQCGEASCACALHTAHKKDNPALRHKSNNQ